MKKHLADQYTPTQSEIEEVICESEAFYVGKTAKGNLYAGLNGKSYIAFMKAAAGISNQGFIGEEEPEGPDSFDEPSRRVLRIIAMEEGLLASQTVMQAIPQEDTFDSNFEKTIVSLKTEEIKTILRCGYYFQKSFGKDLAQAVSATDESELADILRNITHSIRGFWKVNRARRGQPIEQRTKNDQRILQALDVGRQYYLKNRTNPSKAFIINNLNSKKLGYTGPNKRQEWDSFMRKVGFAEFPDEEAPATKLVKKSSRKRNNLKPAIKRKILINRY